MAADVQDRWQQDTVSIEADESRSLYLSGIISLFFESDRWGDLATADSCDVWRPRILDLWVSRTLSADHGVPKRYLFPNSVLRYNLCPWDSVLRYFCSCDSVLRYFCFKRYFFTDVIPVWNVIEILFLRNLLAGYLSASSKQASKRSDRPWRVDLSSCVLPV